MVHYFRKEYAIPKRNKIHDKLVPDLAERVEDFVSKEIRGVKGMHFSFDNWTSRGKENYMVMTGHFITNNWKLAERILHLEKYRGTHTAQDYKEKVLQVTQKVKQRTGVMQATTVDATMEEQDGLTDFQLDITDAEILHGDDAAVGDLVFTTDNAPAVVAALRMDNVTRIPCFAHVTSLAVKRVNSKVPAVKKWKAVCVKVVGHFNSSNHHNDLLMERQRELGVSRPLALV